MALEEYVTVVPRQLNIIEGVYSMHPTLIGYYDLKIFLSIDSERQSRRILERNGPLMYKRFTDEWIPMEDEYFGKMGIPGKCDMVFKV
jgi:uridine kinase